MEMLQRPGMVPVLVFILIFKLGDAAMGFMVKPFWVDAGFSASQIGLVSVNLGLVLSIAGGVTGGWLTDRIGIFRALWILGLFQAVSNLGYAGAAAVLPLHATDAIPFQHQVLMYAASGLESFTGGLGTAAFLAFLMAIVDRRRSATEYALLSSVFALSRSVAGWAGGYGAEAMGYAPYFLLTFFLSFPAYLMLPWVRSMLARTHHD
jgi:PAT family beta-lactamase induction signal transducer AmpG